MGLSPNKVFFRQVAQKHKKIPISFPVIKFAAAHFLFKFVLLGSSKESRSQEKGTMI